MLSHLTQLTIWNYSIFVIHLELNYICTILNNNESIVSLSCYYKPLAINKTNLYLVPCFITCWNLNIVSLKEIFQHLSSIGSIGFNFKSFKYWSWKLKPHVLSKTKVNPCKEISATELSFLKGWPLNLVSHLNQLAKGNLTKENMLSFAHIT